MIKFLTNTKKLNNMENANEIKFRASSSGYLMSEPKEKSPFDKWHDASALAKKYSEDYALIANKETKTANNKLVSISKLNNEIAELAKIKDAPFLSESCKTHLIDVFVSEKHKRKEEINSKYLSKGNERESDSTTLLSRVNKIMYKENKQPEIHLSNDFIKGTPDIYIGKSIEKAAEIIDTKTSWSAHTFFRAQKDKLNPMYYWQGTSYMWLTGATKCTIAYCLVNGTEKAIGDEKRKLAWNYGADPDVNPEYIEKCKQIEINHIFDIEDFKKENPYYQFDNDVSQWVYDIPYTERVFQFKFERNEEDILRLENRIKDCRTWMNENLFNV